jgi:hypothetical protein
MRSHEETVMTSAQSQALWELCRQGLPSIADEAAECWDRGLHFQLQYPVRLARSLEALIEQCNWEVGREQETA